MTVTKCFNSAAPEIVISLEDAKRELRELSIADNKQVKDRFNQNYGADYFSELMYGGYFTSSDCSYHLNN